MDECITFVPKVLFGFVWEMNFTGLIWDNNNWNVLMGTLVELFAQVCVMNWAALFISIRYDDDKTFSCTSYGNQTKIFGIFHSSLLCIEHNGTTSYRITDWIKLSDNLHWIRKSEHLCLSYGVLVMIKYGLHFLLDTCHSYDNDLAPNRRQAIFYAMACIVQSVSRV